MELSPFATVQFVTDQVVTVKGSFPPPIYLQSQVMLYKKSYPKRQRELSLAADFTFCGEYKRYTAPHVTLSTVSNE